LAAFVQQTLPSSILLLGNYNHSSPQQPFPLLPMSQKSIHYKQNFKRNFYHKSKAPLHRTLLNRAEFSKQIL
jgi:hypothetical protein